MLGHFEIGEKLRFVDWREAVDCLDFDDDGIFHKDIETIPSINTNVIIDDWQFHLRLERQASLLDFVSKAMLIGRIQQPRTERPVDL